MQNAAFKVEANIIAAERLEGDDERRREVNPHHPMILRSMN